jgi:hypothetical protein
MIEPGAMEALVQLILWLVVGVSAGLVLALLLEVALWVVYYEVESRRTSE